MADWKSQISYNYNPSYHAYAYGLVYQPGPEQGHGNLASWGDAAGVTDLSNYSSNNNNNPGVTQAYYAHTAAAAARTRNEESPPHSPEQQQQQQQHYHHHHQGAGLVYLTDNNPGGGRLILAGPHRAAYDSREQHEASRRAGSDSTSDSEAHTSPDSWSSGSSREGSLPQTDPATWANKDLDDEASSRSPDAVSEDVPSPLAEEPRVFVVTGDESTSIASLHVPLTAPKKSSTTASNNPKAKVRAAFSETQMNTLVQRFSVQRYLTPAEMKNLAELTGLTYKQVKTWFQNRRMKLRRHQKDTSWVSERYTTNKGSPIHGTAFTNIGSHIPSYQGDGRPQLKEHYTQHMMEAAFKKTAPQNLAFYLAAMGSAAGPAGYTSWSAGPPQTAVPNRPQAAGWSMPPGHYEYNPSAFSSAGVAPANNSGLDTSFESKDGEPVNNRSSLNTAIVHNLSQ